MKRRSTKPKAAIVLCPHGINTKFCLVCKKMTRILSEDQREAFDSINNKDNHHLFVTGCAGSGKSFLVDYIRATTPRTAMTATTGAAAQIVQGRTLHSFAGIHPNFGTVDSKKADARMRACDVLVVDEISMADPNLLLNLFRRFDRAGHAPKLILVGDFLQLPPVDGVPLFEADFWPMFRPICLSQQHRQKDGEFITALNDVRMGRFTDRVRDIIGSRTVPGLPMDCTQLVATRDMAEYINVERLGSLPGTLYRSDWLIKMEDDEADMPDVSKSRMVETLHLKNGARVVLLTNEPDGLWVNGSTGNVDKVTNGSVRVNLDNGKTVDVGKVTDDWYDGDGNVLCTITQYPIRLAWALTIHRSQGMSIDRIGVNMNNHFAAGQTYVALSRCRTREGVYICGNLERLIVDPKALRYYESLGVK